MKNTRVNALAGVTSAKVPVGHGAASTLECSAGEVSKMLTFMLVLLGLALNHSSVISGVNTSFSDPLAVLILLAIALGGGLLVPKAPLGFFMLVSIVSISVALFLTPLWLPSSAPADQVLKSYVKLVTCFGFFILGINLARTGLAQRVLRYFAFGAAMVSALAIVLFVVPWAAGSERLLYGGFRFKGLMNDPNYFAMLALSALAILTRDRELPGWVRNPACLVIVLAVLMSSSKTGVIVLVLWALFTFSRWFVRNDGSRGTAIRGIGVLVGALVGVLLVKTLLEGVWVSQIATAAEQVPALNRLLPLLTDFDAAVNQEGSGRSSAWETAGSLVRVSPLFGVGMGGYADAAFAISGTSVLAHNTYLQLAAEWGLALTIPFFSWVVFLMAKRPTRSDDLAWPAWGYARDVLFILLAGSLAISLNNARIFWLCLGILAGILLIRGGSPSGALPAKAAGSTPTTSSSDKLRPRPAGRDSTTAHPAA